MTSQLFNYLKESKWDKFKSFVINNPKATASCGCGLSFSV